MSRRSVVAVGLALFGLLVTGCSSTASRPPPTDPTTTSAPTTTAAPASLHGSPGCQHRSGAFERSGMHQLRVGGAIRTYRLDWPAHAPSSMPLPMILLFHGFASDADSIAAYTGLPAQAAKAGYVAVTPNGSNHTWQFSLGGTDEAFVTALIDKMLASACIDVRRVDASGFSAGAAFAIIYSCHHEGSIAALATVAVEFQLGCTRPISIVAFHGTKDPAVPFANGAVGLSLPGIHVRGTELNMGDWARLDHCGRIPVATTLGSQVVRQTWGGCARGTGVVLYRIVGGGHTWPGAVSPTGGVGLTTHQVQADSVILQFFRSHQLAGS